MNVYGIWNAMIMSGENSINYIITTLRFTSSNTWSAWTLASAPFTAPPFSSTKSLFHSPQANSSFFLLSWSWEINYYYYPNNFIWFKAVFFFTLPIGNTRMNITKLKYYSNIIRNIGLGWGLILQIFRCIYWTFSSKVAFHVFLDFWFRDHIKQSDFEQLYYLVPIRQPAINHKSSILLYLISNLKKNWSVYSIDRNLFEIF